MINQRRISQFLLALYLPVVIVLLLGLYWQKKQLDVAREQVRSNTHVQALNEDAEYLSSIEGTTLSLRGLERLSWSSNVKLQATRYCIAILFTHFDCDACVAMELQRWQDYYVGRLSDGHVPVASVVAIIRANYPQSFIRELRGLYSFPTLIDHSDDRSIFGKLNIPAGKPLVLLLDNETKKIIYAHLGDASAPERSETFQAKIERFLSESSRRTITRLDR